MSDRSIDSPVRPMKERTTQSVLRKLRGLEDEDDIFKDSGEWTEDMQNDFEAKRAERQAQWEKERHEMIIWYKECENGGEH